MTAVPDCLCSNSGADAADTHSTYRLPVVVGPPKEMRCVSSKSCDEGVACAFGASNPSL